MDNEKRSVWLPRGRSCVDANKHVREGVSADQLSMPLFHFT